MCEHTPHDLHHSRANNDSHNSHNTQHTRVKQSKLCFTQKDTQPSQTCSGGLLDRPRLRPTTRVFCTNHNPPWWCPVRVSVPQQPHTLVTTSIAFIPTLLVLVVNPRTAQSPTACPSLPLVSANSLQDDQPTNFPQPRGPTQRPSRGRASVWTRRYFSIFPNRSPLHDGEAKHEEQTDVCGAGQAGHELPRRRRHPRFLRR